MYRASFSCTITQIVNTEHLKTIDKKHLWHPYASIGNPPPVRFAVSARGTKIYLDDGTELIDAISSWWTVALGHNPPEVVEAIKHQCDEMTHVMFAGFTHRPAAELAETLLDMLPSSLNKIFLADSGSIAVECAAKMAVQYQHACGKPEKCKLAALKGGYHGDTTGAMALSDPDGMHILFRGLLPEHYFAKQPKCRFGEPWIESDFDSMLSVLDTHGSSIAAVIVEPIFQAANAMWMYHPEYLSRLETECNKRDILLICDEIATGFGRTGRLFAHEHAGIVPDILCLGKILTGGNVTLAAAVASGIVADVISKGPVSDNEVTGSSSGAFMHGPTYMGNPVACAAASATLKLFRDFDWQGSVARIEKELTEQLSPMAALPNVRDVRVLGAVGVLELEQMPSADVVNTVIKETGVWLRPFSRFVYTMPPYITTSEEIRRITDAMGKIAGA